MLALYPDTYQYYISNLYQTKRLKIHVPNKEYLLRLFTKADMGISQWQRLQPTAENTLHFP